MEQAIFVDTLENLNPSDFIGITLITSDGSVWIVEATDQLGGIGSFFKKIGEIALNVGGSFVGASGVGTALLGGSSKDAQMLQKYTPKFQEMAATLQQIDADVSAGKVSGEQANHALSAFHNGWQSYKFSAPEKEQGFLYKVEVEQFKSVWDALQIKVNAAIESDKAALAQQQAQTTANGASQVGAGSISPTILIGGVLFAALFILRR